MIRRNLKLAKPASKNNLLKRTFLLVAPLYFGVVPFSYSSDTAPLAIGDLISFTGINQPSKCKALLVRDNAVMTSAHCIYDGNGNAFRNHIFIDGLGNMHFGSKVDASNGLVPGKIDEMSLDFHMVFLDASIKGIEPVPFLPEPYKGVVAEIYYSKNNEYKLNKKSCDVKYLDNNLIFSKNCAFEHGNSGTPLIIDSNGPLAIGLYSGWLQDKDGNKMGAFSPSFNW